MPGEDDGLTPDAAPTEAGHDHHTRIADKARFAGKSGVEGSPGQEGVDAGEAEDELDGSPEDVSLNRRDVPDTPENSYEARTEDSGTSS